MDSVDRYRSIVRELIQDYAACKPSHGQIRTEAIVDRENDHYELMHVGWDGFRRIHGSVLHIDIIDGKVWIQYNGTSERVAEELVAAGIPREAIVLGFQPPHVRPYTDYATGDEPLLEAPLPQEALR